MKNKSTQILLICIAVCLLLCNISLLFLYQKSKNRLSRAVQSMNAIVNLKEDTKFFFDIFKELTITRFRYEQFSLGGTYVYTGLDKNTTQPVQNITDQPKLVLGLNQNMCRPCVEGVFSDIKEFFPDFETNPNIICIADIEQRFKDNYYGKKVVSFLQKDDFPLYEILESPYFFYS